MARNHGVSVDVPGLSKLRRDLKAIDKDLGKALTSHLRGVAREVRDDARSRAPVDEGDLKKTIKHSVTSKGASVYSDSDYAEVHEWGGVIRPRGVPIEIVGRRYTYDAVGDRTGRIRSEVDRILDVVADHNGFH
jgi:phage gpG-like protein